MPNKALQQNRGDVLRYGESIGCDLLKAAVMHLENAMGWLNRIFAGQRASTPGPPATAAECLIAAGWRPGRTYDITAAERTLRNAGFELHEPARRFLGEYYGLAVDVPISGTAGIKGFVHFVPEMVLRLLGPGDLARLKSLMPRSACPIGTTSGHTMYLFLDEYGRSYLLDMEWSLFAPLASSVGDTLQVLCDGRNGRVDGHILDEQGEPTGEVIRAEDERTHWHLDQFSRIARFLPPVSLSPARRPPTWRAMVRAAEQSLAKGANPGSLIVTCGGFASSPSREWFFVAHCENCLYVRAKASFQVSTPPPGIASGFRVGEVLPFQRPPGW